MNKVYAIYKCSRPNPFAGLLHESNDQRIGQSPSYEMAEKSIELEAPEGRYYIRVEYIKS